MLYNSHNLKSVICLHSVKWLCYIAIHEYVKCTSNVHNSYIDNIGILKDKKHLRLLSSSTKLFITFALNVIRHKESDTPSFYADFSICPPTTRGTPLQTTGLILAKVNRLLWMLKLNSLTFLKSPKSSALPGMTSFASLVHFLSGIFILTSLNDTLSPCVHEHLHSCCT